ncbi:MAG: CRTAC1 family protein [Bacteroidota bacterium]
MEADHSWASQLIDFNDDGYLDLIVANDILNRLRVYENEGGKGFKYDERFNAPHWNGSWMGIASGDLNGDMKDEIMLANFGSGTISIRNTAVFASDPEEFTVVALNVLSYMDGKYTAHHGLLSYEEGKGLVDKVKDTYIEHSPHFAPDMTNKLNCAPSAYHVFDEFNYSESIAGLEFAWNPAFFDLENDGDLDVYLVGSLGRGNDGFMGDWTAGPGRLLVNKNQAGGMYFKDQTLDYQLADVMNVEYDAAPPRRQSPGTNWHKKDYVYLQDQDSYAGMGMEASRKSKIRDMFRLHENANGVVAADLNSDGFQDLIVIHAGGNNSTLPSARNLKVDVMGKELALPAPNKAIKAPTNFEDGPTFMYINQGTAATENANWVNIQLLDENAVGNQHAIGAKIIINDKIMRRYNVGGESYSAVTLDKIHVGLGSEKLEKLEIFWPSGDQAAQVIQFDTPLYNETVKVVRDSAL